MVDNITIKSIPGILRHRPKDLRKILRKLKKECNEFIEKSGEITLGLFNRRKYVYFIRYSGTTPEIEIYDITDSNTEMERRLYLVMAITSYTLGIIWWFIVSRFILDYGLPVNLFLTSLLFAGGIIYHVMAYLVGRYD
jgi:hypothetical protein